MEPEEKVNILLVDDDASKMLALENILSSLGQNLVKAHSGKEALRALLGRDFAVVLLDVCMPVMDGSETAAIMRGRGLYLYPHRAGNPPRQGVGIRPTEAATGADGPPRAAGA